MHATKLPLKVWLKAVYLILFSSKGVSSVILGKQLGVRQSTAWKMTHAVREMTDDRDGRDPLLVRIVEVDTTYMGAPPRKKKTKFHRHVWHPPGKGTKRPQVAIAASRDGRVAAAVIRKGDSGAIGRFLDHFVAKDARIMSDNDNDTAIAKAAKGFAGHRTVTHRDDEFARGEVHANWVEGLAALLKRAQVGVFHFISEVYLQRYVDEIMFRRNQREIIVRKNKNGERGFAGDAVPRLRGPARGHSEAGGWPPGAALRDRGHGLALHQSPKATRLRLPQLEANGTC